MNTVLDHSIHSKKPWYSQFDASDHSMELFFKGHLENGDIDSCLQSVQALVKCMPVKTLLINNNDNEKNHLGLNWKIVEATWESIYKNGGKKIIVIHQSNLPAYVKEMYSHALKEYGVPIKLEFKSARKSTVNN